jgi:uncharacterized protein YuzE
MESLGKERPKDGGRIIEPPHEMNILKKFEEKKDMFEKAYETYKEHRRKHAQKKLDEELSITYCKNMDFLGMYWGEEDEHQNTVYKDGIAFEINADGDVIGIEIRGIVSNFFKKQEEKNIGERCNGKPQPETIRLD